MTDRPYPPFYLELVLINTGTHLRVNDPTIVDEKLVNQAWKLLGTFLEDKLEARGVELNDEDARELFIDLMYKLILREMTTLAISPAAERYEMERIASRKPRRKKGDA